MSAAEGGIDFLDTSDAYPLGGELSTRGITEEILGRWLRGKRDRFIVATKCFAPTGPAPFDGGNSRKHIMSAVEASLRRLQTDYIDLYQLHGYDRHTPIDEPLSALDDLVHQGKGRYTGCSNFLTYQLVRAVGRSETLGLTRFDSVQPRYNLLFRQIEREMLPFCAEDGVGVIPYNPIAGGLLSGKHERSAPPGEGTRFTLGTAGGMYQQRYWHDAEFDTVDQLGQLAAQDRRICRCQQRLDPLGRILGRRGQQFLPVLVRLCPSRGLVLRHADHLRCGRRVLRPADRERWPRAD